MFSNYLTQQRFSLRQSATGLCSVLLASLTLMQASPVLAESSETKLAEPTVVLETVETQDLPNKENISQDQTAKGLESDIQQTEHQAAQPDAETAQDQPLVGVKASEEPKSEAGKRVSEVETKVKPSATEPQSSPVLEQSPVAEISPAPSSAYVFEDRAAVAGVIGDDYPNKWRLLDGNKDTDSWSMYVRNCTSFAAYRLSSANGFELPGGYGDAGTWGDIARASGYRVDQTPVRGAIAWSAPSAENKWYGHVAWVAAVNGDTVTVEEYNYGRVHTYGSRTVHKSAFSGYIHFKDIASGQVVASQLANPTQSSHLPSQGTYTFSQRAGVRNQPSLSSQILDYYEIGEKANYDKLLEADNQLWISYVNHRGGRSYVAIQELTPAKPAGSISVQNYNARTGNFEVFITGITAPKPLQAVQVPIWSEKDGQDDLIWYTAQAQADGSYKVSVQNAKHKGDTGTYHIHLYYLQTDGQQLPVGGTSFTVEKQETSQSIKQSGTYVFTKTLPIKSQANLSSPTIDYYYAGERVNYDQLLSTGGHQWLSYISRSGVRRYIPLD